jgi:DNA-binding NarL/FixJ family response regulator
MIRVMIVDDQELIRAGLRTIIDAHPDLTVVAEAADGFAALQLLETTAADVALMDIRMPGIDGVEVTRRLRRIYSPEQLRILVLTTFEQDENVLRAIKAGADGFLGKGAGPVEITTGILEIARGARALSSKALGAVVEHIAHDTSVPTEPAAAELFTRLTAREREVVEAIVSGMDNTEIAEKLFVSPYTAKTHANRAMTKVGARDRAQLVSLAFRAGMRP